MIALIHRETNFNKSLVSLWRAGGVAVRAASEVDSIIGRWVREGGKSDEIGKLTKHGESRIKNCVKYDLTGGYRLVCIKEKGCLLFLHVGSHDDCDRWINNNRGLQFVVDKRTKKISRIQEIEAKLPFPQKVPQAIVDADTPLLEMLDDQDIDLLPLTASDCRRLNSLTRATGDDDVLNAVEAIDEEIKDTVLSVLLALRDHEIENAVALIHTFAGNCVRLDEQPALIENAVGADINSENVINLRELSEREVVHLLKSPNFEDWMLFLHPDQKKAACSLFDLPVFLSGISGSGKTSILIHRAKYLAEQYPGSNIGVFTLNEALATLIDNLLNQLCPTDIRNRILVKPIYDLCREIVRFYDPQKHLLSFDKRSKEDLEDCWTDSYERPEQEQKLEPIIKSLKDTYKVNPSEYLRDEFAWIRSAFACHDDEAFTTSLSGRKEYLGPKRCPRSNRAIRFIADWRARVLKALDFYEEWLGVGGFVDPPALSLEAHRFVSRLKSGDHPFQFRCVLVDEVQDLGTVELHIIAALAPKLPNSLFLTGDPNQQVFPKDHDMKKAGISDLNRKYFRKNYRNTRQIIQAGTALIDGFGQAAETPDSEKTGPIPEYSMRESALPMVIKAESIKEEIDFTVRYITAKRKVDDLPICIVPCGFAGDSYTALNKLKEDYQQAGLQVRLLKRNSTISPGVVFLSPMEAVKGFEFSLVIISRCSKAFIPSSSLPEKEKWRDCQRLYVAMTRAWDELIFTHYGERSLFIDGIGNQLIMDTARNQLSALNNERISKAQ